MSALLERNPDISVIIPCYNLEQYISVMLCCLKNQELGEYSAEIIFVINNCTDNTEGIIKDSGIECQIIHCKTQGCGPARNAALDIARGEYIWFMDGDDWLLSETAVHDALDMAKTNNLDMLRIPYMSNLYHQQCFAMVWQYVFRRAFVDDIRFPDYQPAEDDAYTMQALAKLGLDRRSYLSLPHMDRPLYYYYYMRDGSNMMRHHLGEL